jgi:hypothetical protein
VSSIHFVDEGCAIPASKQLAGIGIEEPSFTIFADTSCRNQSSGLFFIDR